MGYCGDAASQYEKQSANYLSRNNKNYFSMGCFFGRELSHTTFSPYPKALAGGAGAYNSRE
jgi:hypothetical protein